MKKYQKYIKYIVFSLLIVSGFYISVFTPGKAETAYAADTSEEVKVIYLNAYYSGESVLIGEEYDTDNVYVTAYYSDGSYNTISAGDYITGSRVVTKTGLNTFVIVYGGKTSNIYVYGISVTNIYATYSGSSLSVGNSVSEDDINLYVVYSDGTVSHVEEGYTIYNNVIEKIGTNVVYITYGTKTVSVNVNGTAQKSISELMAVYSGKEQTIGLPVKTDSLSVVALYTDGTTEIINNYTLSPSTISNMDANVITVTFRGKSAKFTVNGIPKVAVSLEAEYTGDKVAVGKNVRTKNLTVTVTYADGAKEELADTEYTLKNNGKIVAEGGNTIYIEYKDLRATVVVVGVLSENIDFTKVPAYSVTNGKRSAIIRTALPEGYDETDFAVKSIDASFVKRCLPSEVRSGDYISFAVRYEDEDLEIDMPITVRIDLPSMYVIEGLSIYYTPNRKTVIGKMPYEIIDKDTVEITLYNEGTYVIAFDPDWKAKLEEEEENNYDPWW